MVEGDRLTVGGFMVGTRNAARRHGGRMRTQSGG
jgi:hypothetical protein